MKLLIYFIIFAMMGVAHEIFWTGIIDSIKTKNPRLRGRSSLWMFLIYGSVIFIILLVRWLFADYSWWFRGLVYAVLIMQWEYISGFIIEKLIGVPPWDYSMNNNGDGINNKKRFYIGGFICLEYFPIWFIEGLIAEWIFLFLQNNLFL